MRPVINKMDNKIKIRTCRICLDAKSVDMVLIEEQNGWLKLFEFCFGFALTTQDEPRLLCQKCANTIKTYVKFKEKCQKSHNLWKLVISDVKCHIIKHENLENPKATNEYDKEHLADTTKYIKKELLDLNFDDDTHFSTNDVEDERNCSSEIKMKIYEDTAKEEDNCTKKKDWLVRNYVKPKQMKSKIPYSDDSVKCIENKVYTCAKCKDSYARKCWYLKHIKQCKAKRKKRKHNLDYSYDLGRKLEGQYHDKVKQEPQNKIVMLGNPSESLFACGLCNLSFTDAKDVLIHLNDHWSNNNLECKLCDFVGVDLAAIVSHRYSHLPRTKYHFVCHICEKTPHSLIALHFHYRSLHLNKPGGYCSRCDKEYSMLHSWKRHEKNHVEPKYICDICGRGYGYRSDITAHIEDHMHLDKGICDICGKILARKRYLKSHKAAVHNELGPIKCTHCNRMFKSQFSLKIHLQFVTRKRTLECGDCHKKFITPHLLRQHMIAHNNERPFKCDFCGRNYKRKSQLTVHLIKHNGNVPQCPICMKTFSTSMSLKRHSSVHTGVRNYRCKVSNCIRTFHSKKQMLAHMQLRHKNEISEKNQVLQEKTVYEVVGK